MPGDDAATANHEVGALAHQLAEMVGDGAYRAAITVTFPKVPIWGLYGIGGIGLGLSSAYKSLGFWHGSLVWAFGHIDA